MNRVLPRAPRILFLVNVDWAFLSHRIPIACAARDRGAEVWVAGTSTGQEGRITAEGLRFVHIPFYRSGKNVFRELGTFREVAQVLRRIRPDLVHNFSAKPVLYGSLLSRYIGKPAVVNAIPGLGYLFISSDAGARLLRQVVGQAYRATLSGERLRVIFENPDDLELFVSAGMVDRGCAVLIRGAGVDVEQFRAAPEPEGIPVVMFASRMLKDKGTEELAAAARRLKEWKIPFRMVFVGDPDPDNPATVTEGALRTWVGDGLIEWWGHKTGMEAVLPLAAVVALPSYREGLPKVLLEAAAVGRPIVATDVPGCREAVRDGWNGCLVPPRDSERLAEALRRLLENRELRARMGANGREMAEREFRIEKVVADTFSVYDDLLSADFPGVFAPNSDPAGSTTIPRTP